MTRTILMMMVALPLAFGACGGDKPAADGGDKPAESADANEADANDAADEAAEPLDPRVEKAVTVANAIAADPDSADAILEKNGLDREKFEELMYEIAKDPALSESYAVNREA